MLTVLVGGRGGGWTGGGEKLTPREPEIVRGLEDGLNYKLIAERLFISPEKVRNHIRHVYCKLEGNSKGELLALSLRRQRA